MHVWICGQTTCIIFLLLDRSLSASDLFFIYFIAKSFIVQYVSGECLGTSAGVNMVGSVRRPETLP